MKASFLNPYWKHAFLTRYMYEYPPEHQYTGLPYPAGQGLIKSTYGYGFFPYFRDVDLIFPPFIASVHTTV